MRAWVSREGWAQSVEKMAGGRQGHRWAGLQHALQILDSKNVFLVQ